MKPISIIVTGATGLVGAEVVRQAIADNNIKNITAIVRAPLDLKHEKLNIIIHKDFLEYTSLTKTFKDHDACIWALGISTTQVNKEQYFMITHDYAVAAAKAMFVANPTMRFIFVSGEGAGENATTRFGKVKFQTETELLAMSENVLIARPGGIQPINRNPNTALLNKLFLPFFPLFKTILPKLFITSVQLAHALLNMSKAGVQKKIFSNQDLRVIAKSR